MSIFGLNKVGKCRVCGCTNDNPCFHPDHGFCWWADEAETICSHCACEEIANDPETVHCVNSKECETFVFPCYENVIVHKGNTKGGKP